MGAGFAVWGFTNALGPIASGALLGAGVFVLVRTDRDVKIVEGSRLLSGRGMEYNNESRELVLRADVVARFAPHEVE